ncbi:MAG: hypothetical protein ACYDDO_09135 [Acidiferrobacterales bacterium]
MTILTTRRCLPFTCWLMFARELKTPDTLPEQLTLWQSSRLRQQLGVGPQTAPIQVNMAKISLSD